MKTGSASRRNTVLIRDTGVEIHKERKWIKVIETRLPGSVSDFSLRKIRQWEDKRGGEVEE